MVQQGQGQRKQGQKQQSRKQQSRKQQSRKQQSRKQVQGQPNQMGPQEKIWRATFFLIACALFIVFFVKYNKPKSYWYCIMALVSLAFALWR